MSIYFNIIAIRNYVIKKIIYEGDQKVREKVLLNRIAFINCNENS